MERFWAYSRILETGAPAPGSTVTVFLADQPLVLATIYADNLEPPTPKANPFTAGLDGYLFFYAPNGRYNVRNSGGGIVTPYTWGDIQLGDVGTVGSGSGIREISLGGSRESGPLVNADPETFDLVNFPPEGVYLPAGDKLAVGTTVSVVLACQAPVGGTVQATLKDADGNTLATDPDTFTDDTQMVIHTFDVPLQAGDEQVFVSLTVTGAAGQPGLLAIAKLVFTPPA